MEVNMETHQKTKLKIAVHNNPAKQFWGNRSKVG
jgi:hypothetical protein